MIAIEVRLLHGWTRATGATSGALMGNTTSADAEWPLAPARLFAALVAGGGTGPHRTVSGDDSELIALERANPPRIIADAPEDVVMSPINERFVVDDATQPGIVQNYPGRKATTSRPGVRISPRHPVLTYVWPDLDLTSEQATALEQRAARVGYLGGSDAPAHVLVTDCVPSERPTWTPGDGESTVSVPFDGSLAVLDAAFERFRSGDYLPASTIRRQASRYRGPGEATPPTPGTDRPTSHRIWVTLDRRLPGNRVLAVTEALRGLVLSAFGALGSPDEAPSYISGHGLPPDAERPRFVALPNVGNRHANGALHGCLVQLPAVSSADDLRRVRLRLAGGELHLPGGTARRLSINDDPRLGSYAANPARWSGPAFAWTSATPVVFERFSKHGPSHSEVGDWCELAGLPRPIESTLSRTPLVAGGVDLRPHQARRPGHGARPYAHLGLIFDQALDGPITIGRLRNFGLGLMVPVDLEQAVQHVSDI